MLVLGSTAETPARSQETDPSVILVVSTKIHSSDSLVLLANDYRVFSQRVCRCPFTILLTWNPPAI